MCYSLFSHKGEGLGYHKLSDLRADPDMKRTDTHAEHEQDLIQSHFLSIYLRCLIYLSTEVQSPG